MGFLEKVNSLGDLIKMFTWPAQRTKVGDEESKNGEKLKFPKQGKSKEKNDRPRILI